MKIIETNGSLQVTNTGTAPVSIDWFVTYEELNPANGVVSLYSAQGNISSATTTTLVGSPATGNERCISFLSLTNNDVNGQTVVVQKVVGAGTYSINQSAMLLQNYSFQYELNVGWSLYNGNGVRITLVSTGGGSGGGVAISAGTNSTGSGTVQFSNANGVTFGMNTTGVITASVVPAGGLGSFNLFGANTSGNTTASGSTIGLSGINLTLSGTNASQIVFSAPPTSSIVAGANITLSTAGSTVTIIGGAGGGGGGGGYSTEAVYVAGNSTGQSSQSTYTVNSFNVSAAGLVSAGWSSNSFIVSAPGTASATIFSGGFSTGGNTTGTTGNVTGQLILAGGNNITLSGSTNGGSMTVTVIGGAGGGGVGSFNLLGVNTSGNTTASGSTIGLSGINLTLSGTNASQIVFSAPPVSNLVGGANITLSSAGSTITIIGGAGGGGGGVAVSAGTNSTSTGTVVFSNSNGLTFGMNTTGVITGSYTVPTQTNQTLSAIVSSNTFGNTSGMTFDARSLSLQGYGAISVGLSTTNTGSSVVFSAPAVSNLVGGANITLSSAGSTITIIGGAGGGGGGGVAISAGGTSTSTGTVVFSNSNGITFGMNTNAVVTASYTVPTQTNQTMSAIVSGNTTGNTSGMTFDARSHSFQGYGGVSVGLSTTNTGSSIVFSAPPTSSIVAGANITLSTAGSTVTIIGSALAATGISGIVVSNSTFTSGTVTFSNSNGITFGGAGANIVTASFSTSQSVQTQAAGNIGGTGFATTTTNGVVIVGTNATNGITLAVPPYITTYAGVGASVGVSNIGNTLGNTGTYSGQVIFAGGNNITLSVSSAAGGAQTITISGPNVGGAQTGISGIIVSNTTYTSGTVSFSNANGISFGSSAGQAITASYTVPTVYTTVGLISAINLSAGTTSTNATAFTFSNSNNISFGISSGAGAGVITASFSTSQSVQTQAAGNIGGTGFATTTTNGVVIVGTNATNGITLAVPPYITTYVAQTNQTMSAIVSGNTTGNTSGMTFDARSHSFQGYGGVSVGLSTTNTGSSILISGPATSSIVAGANITLSSAGATVTIIGGAGGNLAVSGGAGNSNTVTGMTFANSNGLTFGVSTGASAATITGSYTVPTQSNQTMSAIVSGNTTGNTSGMTFDARSVSFQGYGAASVGLSTTNTGSSILISVPVQSVQTQAAGNIGGTGFATTTTNGTVIVGTNATNGITLAVPPYITTYAGVGASVGVSNIGNTLGNTGTYSGQVVFAGGNNITLSVSSAAGGAQTITISGPNVGGAQTGISAIVVSNSTFTSGTVTFSNSNGISFGGGGANIVTASYTVPSTAGLLSAINISAGTTSNNLSAVTFSNANGVSIGLNASTVTLYIVPNMCDVAYFGGL